MSAVAERLSVAEYLERERASELRHQYVDGEMIEVTGASEPHNAIVVNLVLALGSRFRDRPARVYANDMRVECPTGWFVYPDVAIVSGPPELADDFRDTLRNPVVVIEVLSPSTERFDRGRKFEHYRSIPSLREYVLVAQDRVSVERYVRGPDPDRWEFSCVMDVADSIELEPLGIRLPLTEIYAKVVLP